MYRYYGARLPFVPLLVSAFRLSRVIQDVDCKSRTSGYPLRTRIPWPCRSPRGDARWYCYTHTGCRVELPPFLFHPRSSDTLSINPASQPGAAAEDVCRMESDRGFVYVWVRCVWLQSDPLAQSWISGVLGSLLLSILGCIWYQYELTAASKKMMYKSCHMECFHWYMSCLPGRYYARIL